MDCSALKEACESGASISKMAARFGRSKTTIRWWLKKYGLQTSYRFKATQVGQKCVCPYCEKQYVFDPTKGHSLTICNSCLVLRRKYEVKAKLVSVLGGECSRCKYAKCIGALQFHHPDDTKEFGVAGNYNRAFRTLLKEAKKCQLLCANCHAEIHFGNRKWTIRPVGFDPTASSV